MSHGAILSAELLLLFDDARMRFSGTSWVGKTEIFTMYYKGAIILNIQYAFEPLIVH
jgi:hypothetical protein